MKTNRVMVWRVGLGWGSGRWGWWRCSSTQQGLGREHCWAELNLSCGSLTRLRTGWNHLFVSFLLFFHADQEKSRPVPWRVHYKPFKSVWVQPHGLSTPTVHTPTRLHLSAHSQGVKSRSPDPGCDSVWKLPPLLCRKHIRRGWKRERGRERKWSGERGEIEGGGGAPRQGWSNDLMLLLVSAEHQLTWFPGCYKGRRKQSNLQPYYRRHDTMNDNDIYCY